MDFTKLWAGLVGSMWHTDFIQDDVTLPALYLYHKLDLDCDLLSFSTNSDISCVKFKDIQTHTLSITHDTSTGYMMGREETSMALGMFFVII